MDAFLRAYGIFQNSFFLEHLWASKVTAWYSIAISDESQRLKISWWKMVPWPFPSLISSVIGCLNYGFFTCHYYFGSNSKELPIKFYVKLITRTRAWERNSAILLLTKSTWFLPNQKWILMHFKAKATIQRLKLGKK